MHPLVWQQHGRQIPDKRAEDEADQSHVVIERNPPGPETVRASMQAPEGRGMLAHSRTKLRCVTITLSG